MLSNIGLLNQIVSYNIVSCCCRIIVIVKYRIPESQSSCNVWMPGVKLSSVPRVFQTVVTNRLMGLTLFCQHKLYQNIHNNHVHVNFCALRSTMASCRSPDPVSALWHFWNVKTVRVNVLEMPSGFCLRIVESDVAAFPPFRSCFISSVLLDWLYICGCLWASWYLDARTGPTITRHINC